MSSRPTKLIAALEKYLDPTVPPEKQGLPMKGSPPRIVFILAAADEDAHVDFQIMTGSGGFEILLMIGSNAYPATPVFEDTAESAQRLVRWLNQYS